MFGTFYTKPTYLTNYKIIVSLDSEDTDGIYLPKSIINMEYMESYTNNIVIPYYLYQIDNNWIELIYEESKISIVCADATFDVDINFEEMKETIGYNIIDGKTVLNPYDWTVYCLQKAEDPNFRVEHI